MRLLALAAAASLQLLNVSSAGVQGNGHSMRADVSGDGRRVAFDSFAGNLERRSVALDQEVYVRDRGTGTTRMVSVSQHDRPSNAWSWFPSLSPSGRFVAFCSTASNLARPDRRPLPDFSPGYHPRLDVFVRDLRRGTLALTPRARHVLHWCNDGLRLYDRGSGEVVVVSPDDGETSAAGVSADGGTVVFCTDADRLQPRDALGDSVFVWRRGGAGPVSLANAGVCTDSATVSADGRTAIFSANMPGLVPADTSDPRQSDVFAAEPLG